MIDRKRCAHDGARKAARPACRRRAINRAAFGAALLGAVLSSAASETASAGPAAFPGAYGFGAVSTGGRGGSVIAVTSLADGGAGSLRACVEASGPRTCVFRVGGTIVLNNRLSIDKDDITIAGQTAPGDGIQVRLAPTTREGGPLLSISADDVIIRHLRLRRGPTSLARRPQGTCCGDVVVVKNAERVMLDHLSMAFSTDELFDVYNSRRVTLQNSILSYALARSTATLTVRTGKGHSKGFLSGYGSDRVSFLNNLVAMVEARGCRVKSGGRNDCRGNYFYGIADREVVVSNGAELNLVRNAMARPADMTEDVVKAVVKTRGGAAVFADGNDLGADRKLWSKGADRLDGPVPTEATPSGLDADNVRREAGAWPRDALDRRVVGHVAAGAGSYADKPSDADGWPSLASGTAYADIDRDGMDDLWEAANGLNPGNPEDRNGDADGDGYTNLEEFLADLARSRPS